MIRKLGPNKYRLYSLRTDPRTGKRRNLGTFRSRAAALRHERQIEFFKRRGR
ncbi:MAG TPA: hypothetical protein VKB45_11760 [Gemmatimonadales bacterium]|nr:hypothetical protein [Gemmatimonadales bacterium]